MLTEEAAMEREAFRERVLKEGMHPCRVPCLDAMAIRQVVHHLTRTYLLTLVDLPEHHSAVTAHSETVTLYRMLKLLLREIAAGDHRLAEIRFYRHGLRDKLNVESGSDTFGRLRASWLTTSGFDRLTTSGLLGISANHIPLTTAFRRSDRHTEFPHQPLAGIGERKAAYLHDKADDITALAAAETLEDVARCIQMERRVVVVMQRTEATATGLACAVESHAQV